MKGKMREKIGSKKNERTPEKKKKKEVICRRNDETNKDIKK